MTLVCPLSRESPGTPISVQGVNTGHSPRNPRSVVVSGSTDLCAMENREDPDGRDGWFHRGQRLYWNEYVRPD